MDVRCERCKTEYEFDDALVSGRGTTVRCTQCGHQFKVRRAEVTLSTGASERWIITTASGQTLVHHTLRELQRAILAKQVERRDVLSYAGAPPRALGSIEELEPFFDGRAPLDTREKLAPVPLEHVDTLRPPAAAPAVPPPVESQSFTFGTSPTIASRAVRPSDVGSSTPPLPFVTPEEAAPSSIPPAVRGHQGAPHLDANGAAPPAIRRWPEEDDPFSARSSLPSSAAGRRRNLGGWVVAVVLLLGVGVVGFAVVRPYFMKPPAAAAEPGRDPRIDQFLKEGDKSLEDGALDAAQESFDKAGALAAKDPRVLVAAARLAAVKADVPWLRARLLPLDATADRQTVGQELEPLAAAARARADNALTAAPLDPGAVRAKVDALRILGDRPGARGLASRLTGDSPEAAYVLAALDLAEPEPLWTTVLDRLHTAARAEGRIGRARAALVYALVRSGDAASARMELGRLAAGHPLAAPLRAYVEHAEAQPVVATAGDAGATKGKEVAQADLHGGGAEATDARSALKLAADALRHHDTRRARQLYEGILARKPADSEALAGLGDVLRSSGDTSGAIVQYRRALGVNPSYLPALVGLADAEWASGDRAGAVRLYSDIVDRFPEGTYPAYVKSRAEGATHKDPAPKPVDVDNHGEAPAAPTAEAPPAPPPATLQNLPPKEE